MDEQYYDIERRTTPKETARELRRKYLRYKDAEIVYSMTHKKLLELAERAGAIYRIDGYVLLDKDIFDEFLEQFHVPAKEGLTCRHCGDKLEVVGMAGNAWKYSHLLDAVDLEFLQHDFITIKMGVEYYGFSERPFLRMAKEAGAYYKIGKMVRIRRDLFDSYLRKMRRVPRIGGKLSAKS